MLIETQNTTSRTALSDQKSTVLPHHDHYFSFYKFLAINSALTAYIDISTMTRAHIHRQRTGNARSLAHSTLSSNYKETRGCMQCKSKKQASKRIRMYCSWAANVRCLFPWLEQKKKRQKPEARSDGWMIMQSVKNRQNTLLCWTCISNGCD